MKTSSKKQKGRKLQYWVCEKICELFNIEFEQQNDLCFIQSRNMGQKGTDVQIKNSELYEKFIYDVECKNTETIKLYDYIKQSKKNTKEGRQWLVVHKKNHSDPIVILDANHFFTILKKILDKEK